MELISGKLKRVIIGCTVIGVVLGLALGTLLVLFASESAEVHRTAVRFLVLNCLLGAFVGFCFSLCIGVTNRIVYRYSITIKIISHIIAVIIATGLVYFFFIMLNYLNNKLFWGG